MNSRTGPRDPDPGFRQPGISDPIHPILSIYRLLFSFLFSSLILLILYIPSYLSFLLSHLLSLYSSASTVFHSIIIIILPYHSSSISIPSVLFICTHLSFRVASFYLLVPSHHFYYSFLFHSVLLTSMSLPAISIASLLLSFLFHPYCFCSTYPYASSLSSRLVLPAISLASLLLFIPLPSLFLLFYTYPCICNLHLHFHIESFFMLIPSQHFYDYFLFLIPSVLFAYALL
jgi:hypothetical protein